MANDAPTLDNFTFRHPPKPANVFWEPQLVEQRLSDGSLVSHSKGFILKGELVWGDDGWIDGDEYSNVAVMVASLTATSKYYPRPNTYAARFFRVQISDVRFIPHGGDLQKGTQLYEGSISFESSVGEITATPTDIF